MAQNRYITYCAGSELLTPDFSSYNGERGINPLSQIAMVRTVVWVFILLLYPVCFGQKVTVRVINAKNGHPLPKQTVFVQFLYEQPPAASSPVQVQTDGTGRAQFTIPEPQPEHLNVRVALTSEHWHCACWVMTDTEKVIRNGLVQTDRLNSPSAQVNAEAGEIVFIARPFTFFERALYPLVKQ